MTPMLIGIGIGLPASILTLIAMRGLLRFLEVKWMAELDRKDRA